MARLDERERGETGQGAPGRDSVSSDDSLAKERRHFLDQVLIHSSATFADKYPRLFYTPDRDAQHAALIAELKSEYPNTVDLLRALRVYTGQVACLEQRHFDRTGEEIFTAEEEYEKVTDANATLRSIYSRIELEACDEIEKMRAGGVSHAEIMVRLRDVFPGLAVSIGSEFGTVVPFSQYLQMEPREGDCYKRVDHLIYEGTDQLSEKLDLLLRLLFEENPGQYPLSRADYFVDPDIAEVRTKKPRELYDEPSLLVDPGNPGVLVHAAMMDRDDCYRYFSDRHWAKEDVPQVESRPGSIRELPMGDLEVTFYAKNTRKLKPFEASCLVSNASFDGDHVRFFGAQPGLSHDFYREFIAHRYVDSPPTDPLQWAYESAKITAQCAAGAGVYDGFHYTLHQATKPYVMIASEVANVTPERLMAPRTIPMDLKKKSLLSALKKCYQRLPEPAEVSPEVTWLVLHNSEHFSEESLLGDPVARACKTIDDCVARGMPIDRLAELVINFAKSPRQAPNALVHAAEIVEGLYLHADGAPWWFAEDMDFSMFCEKGAKQNQELVKEFGPLALHVIPLMKSKAREVFEMRRRLGADVDMLRDVVVPVVRDYGVGNLQRAQNIIDLLHQSVTQSAVYGEVMMKTVMPYLHAVRPRNELIGKLEGEDATVYLPGMFDACSMYLGSENTTKNKSHETNLTWEQIVKFISAAQNPDAQKLRDPNNLQHVAEGFRADIARHRSSVIDNRRFVADRDPNGGRYHLNRFFAFYKAALDATQGSAKSMTSLLQNYWTFYAPLMGDVFAPTQGFFQLILDFEALEDPRKEFSYLRPVYEQPSVMRRNSNISIKRRATLAQLVMQLERASYFQPEQCARWLVDSAVASPLDLLFMHPARQKGSELKSPRGREFDEIKRKDLDDEELRAADACGVLFDRYVIAEQLLAGGFGDVSHVLHSLRLLGAVSPEARADFFAFAEYMFGSSPLTAKDWGEIFKSIVDGFLLIGPPARVKTTAVQHFFERNEEGKYGQLKRVCDLPKECGLEELKGLAARIDPMGFAPPTDAELCAHLRLMQQAGHLSSMDDQVQSEFGRIYWHYFAVFEKNPWQPDPQTLNFLARLIPPYHDRASANGLYKGDYYESRRAAQAEESYTQKCEVLQFFFALQMGPEAQNISFKAIQNWLIDKDDRGFEVPYGLRYLVSETRENRFEAFCEWVENQYAKQIGGFVPGATVRGVSEDPVKSIRRGMCVSDEVRDSFSTREVIHAMYMLADGSVPFDNGQRGFTQMAALVGTVATIREAERDFLEGMSREGFMWAGHSEGVNTLQNITTSAWGIMRRRAYDYNFARPSFGSGIWESRREEERTRMVLERFSPALAGLISMHYEFPEQTPTAQDFAQLMRFVEVGREMVTGRGQVGNTSRHRYLLESDDRKHALTDPRIPEFLLPWVPNNSPLLPDLRAQNVAHAMHQKLVDAENAKLAARAERLQLEHEALADSRRRESARELARVQDLHRNIAQLGLLSPSLADTDHALVSSFPSRPQNMLNVAVPFARVLAVRQLEPARLSEPEVHVDIIPSSVARIDPTPINPHNLTVGALLSGRRIFEAIGSAPQPQPVEVILPESVITREVRHIIPPVEQEMFDYRGVIKQCRKNSFGLLPIGGKSHVAQDVAQRIDGNLLNHVAHMMGVNQTIFRLLRAEKSLVLPPVPSVGEFIFMVQALIKLNVLREDFKPDLQLAAPGRLTLDRTAMLAIAVLMSSDHPVMYAKDAFCTAEHNDRTAARIMAYDDGHPNLIMPFMDGISAYDGRTDMLGITHYNDATVFNDVSTVLSHEQRNQRFAEHGRWFKDEVVRVLRSPRKKSDRLEWLLYEQWVYPRDGSNTKEANDRHHRAVMACVMPARHNIQTGSHNVAHRMRELTDQLRARLAEESHNLLNDPSVCKERETLLG